ncbi:hypothetical protein FD30_GL000119 [Levilactobacillus namurensis DSM 19117]|uniref:Uncharacterized protein n=1 Tax=Levilactobacillus namurensis DSM 19117 TaxID=1423773 RepID=A0A0R1K2N3_9LACO|nr:hypothetical protein FD30_GL000119 [Levilactobacillus namurensis DSM 19117]
MHIKAYFLNGTKLGYSDKFSKRLMINQTSFSLTPMIPFTQPLIFTKKFFGNAFYPI